VQIETPLLREVVILLEAKFVEDSLVEVSDSSNNC